MFQDLTVGSANKQRHRVMKWPAPGRTACHHDHSEEWIPVRTTAPYQSNWFQSSPPTHFFHANEQAISPSQTQKHSHRGLTCCGIESLCSLSKFSIIKSKPNSCNNSFNWTVLPATEAVQFFSNLILKFLCCSLYLLLQFSSLSLPTVRNATEQAPIQNNMQIKCKMSCIVNVITNTSRDSHKSQANLQQPLILNALVHQTSILFPSKCLLRHQFLCKAHWCLVEMPPVHEWKENILGSKGRSCSLYHSATYSV